MHTHNYHTEDMSIVKTVTHWIVNIAKRYKGEGIKSIHHKMDIYLLAEAHHQLNGKKSPGVDGVTKAEYGKNLSERLKNLLSEVCAQVYRAVPVKRAWIPKENGEFRGLGIPAHEDKVLQKAVVMLVGPVFEIEFHNGSFGFRPGRNCHQAVRALDKAIYEGHYWIIDMDIRKYFDSIPHGPLLEMFRNRIKDGVLNRLILGWLKAGVLDEGNWEESKEGTPQGGIISPLLANLYLHEVLDKWIENVVKPRLLGSVKLVRFADDAVLCFTREDDARSVMEVLGKRLGKYGLELHPEKTKLIDYRPKKDGGKVKSETFDFLGFTFYWGKSQKGKSVSKLKTMKKRFRAKLKEIGEWCRDNRHQPVAKQQKELKVKLEGHIRYYGMTHNFRSVRGFIAEAERQWWKWLNRRGSPKRVTWEKFREKKKLRPWAVARIVHSLGREEAPVSEYTPYLI